MKLYLAAGQYAGTQADARKLDRDFKSVEVPTDKAGLIEFLNKIKPAATATPPPAPPVRLTRKGCKDLAVKHEAELLAVVHAGRELTKQIAALDILNP